MHQAEGTQTFETTKFNVNRDRHTDRQSDRQTKRQTDGQSERQSEEESKEKDGCYKFYKKESSQCPSAVS